MSLLSRPFLRSLGGLLFAVLLLISPAYGLDKVRVETRVDEAVAAYGVDGEGVIVALLDRGIDWQNNDFRNEDGTTRIKYIFDPNDPAGANAAGNTYGLGTIYTEAQINAALSTGGTLAHRDAVGHGTTTAAIPAGNGRNSTDQIYRGVAPKASIIAVKVTSDGAPAHGDQAAEVGFFNVSYVLNGIQFIVDKAEELGMPVVMLLNVGSTGGPTDGTDSIARKIDEVTGADTPGVIFVTGPGDDGGADNRAEASIAPGESISLQIEKAQAGNLRFELWYPSFGDGDTGFDISIQAPSGTIYGPFSGFAAEGGTTSNSAPGVYTYYHRGNLADFSASTSNKRQVLIDFGGPTGTYMLQIQRPAGASGNRSFTATLNPSRHSQNPPNRFLNYVVPGNIWTGATAFNNITPTNYVLQREWTDVNGVNRTASANEGLIGEIWPGSSTGPTVDGRIGVDVAAPGEFLITTYAPNSYWATFDFNLVQKTGGYYGRANAVSAAAPIVTGIIALMLDANPKLNALQVREILRQTARADTFTGSTPNIIWGHGKVDAYAAVRGAADTLNSETSILLTVSGDDPEIFFKSVAGVSYKIEYKDELNAGDWTELTTGLLATGDVTSYLDTSLGETGKRFYRITTD